MCKGLIKSSSRNTIQAYSCVRVDNDDDDKYLEDSSDAPRSIMIIACLSQANHDHNDVDDDGDE